MSWVAEAGCNRCGVIEVDARDVLLGSGPGGASRFVFRVLCPSCHVLLLQPVDALAVCALMTAGARWDEWRLPPELAERPDDTVPPITEQDVVAFVGALSLLPAAADPSD